MPPRPDKIKFEVVKIPSNVHFSDAIVGTRSSSYKTKLSEALSSNGAIKVTKGDSYIIQQLRNASKKLKVRLVFGVDDLYVYVKPIAVEGEQKRLLLLLREPRTLAELQAKKLELDLDSSLDSLSKQGLAVNKGRIWTLTESGVSSIQTN